MRSANKLKIALLHLYSNGDCLFATIIVKQIKMDYPNSHLTWYISSSSIGMVENNPHIDEIIQIEVSGGNGPLKWNELNKSLNEAKAKQFYDLYFSTQLIAENELNYCGSIRASVLRNYPFKITVNLAPEIYLTNQEIEKVKTIKDQWGLSKYKNIILFECGPYSNQSSLNPTLATQFAENMLIDLEDTCFILTSGEIIFSKNKNIFDASILSIRQNAELINHCTHLIGCSSGISWISISSMCKQIPSLQMLNPKAFYFNSMKRDFLYLNQNSDHITEIKFHDEFENLRSQIMHWISNTAIRRSTNNKSLLSDESKTVYTLARNQILNGNINGAFQIIKNCYFLNRKNLNYYENIFRFILLLPINLFLRNLKLL